MPKRTGARKREGIIGGLVILTLLVSWSPASWAQQKPGKITIEEAEKAFDDYYSAVAKEDWERLVEGFETKSTTGLGLVFSLNAIGRQEEARLYARRLCEVADQYVKHVKKGPPNLGAFFCCRSALEQVGDYETALIYALRNIERVKALGFEEDYLDAARLAGLAGKPEESIKWYEEEIRHDPKNVLAYDGLSKVLVAARKDYQRAAEVLRAGIEAELNNLASLSRKDFGKDAVYTAPRRPERLPFAPLSIRGVRDNEDRKRVVKEELDKGWIDVTDDMRKLQIDASEGSLQLFLRDYIKLLRGPEDMGNIEKLPETPKEKAYPK